MIDQLIQNCLQSHKLKVVVKKAMTDQLTQNCIESHKSPTKAGLIAKSYKKDMQLTF